MADIVGIATQRGDARKEQIRVPPGNSPGKEKQFGAQQGIDMRDTLPPARPHPRAVIDNHKTGRTIENMVQAVALSPVKPPQVYGRLTIRATGRIGQHRDPRSLTGQGLQISGALSMRHGHLFENRAGHLQAIRSTAQFDGAGPGQQDGRGCIDHGPHGRPGIGLHRNDRMKARTASAPRMTP